MNLLVFGANGPTGRLLVDQARTTGHTVTAFVREGASGPVESARLVRGDATDPAAVQAAIPGHDAVLCALGVRNTSRSGRLMERALSAIAQAMEQAGTRRLVVMSALGVGSTRAQAPWLPRLMYSALLGDIFRDKAAGEHVVSGSSLEWTFVYPPLLTDGPLTTDYRAGETLPLTGFPRISRASVAHFMLTALDSPRWVRRRVIVSA